MENQSDLYESQGVNWQLVIELSRLGVIFDQEELVNPVMQHVEDAGERIKNWHASREHEDAPKIGVVLSINVVA